VFPVLVPPLRDLDKTHCLRPIQISPTAIVTICHIRYSTDESCGLQLSFASRVRPKVPCLLTCTKESKLEFVRLQGQAAKSKSCKLMSVVAPFPVRTASSARYSCLFQSENIHQTDTLFDFSLTRSRARSLRARTLQAAAGSFDTW
jgi:hypothetical protein